MITKITEANDQEYYAPRFEYITAELQKRDDLADVSGATNADLDAPITFITAENYSSAQGVESSVALDDGSGFSTIFTQDTAEFRLEAHRHIIIDSVEAYFANIEAIGQLYTEGHEDVNPGYLFLTMPADEDYFEINANTRAIAIPSSFKKNGVGVYGDHLAEMLVFKIDRYFDYQDLYNTKIAINWNFIPSGSRAYLYDEVQEEEAFAPNDVLEPEYIVFGFPITKEMTPGKGTLEFSVSFYTVGPSEGNEDDLIDYALNTMTASVAINAGLSLKDPREVKSVAKALLKRVQNSSYSADGIAPIATPEWRTGDVDPDNAEKHLGLTSILNFEMNNDGSEPEFITIPAQAYSASHLGGMNYVWAASSLEGNVTNGELKVVKSIDKLANVNPSANEAVPSQFNQNAISVERVGSNVFVHGVLSALNEFQSSDPNQGSAKWIGIDIEVLAESVEGLVWCDSYTCGASDVDDSATVGLGPNHIVFWAKAEDLVNGKTVSLADDSDRVELTFFFVDESKVASPSDFISVFVKEQDSVLEENHVYYYKNEQGKYIRIASQEEFADDNIIPIGTEIFELGSSYKAFGAGIYQVKAQASKVVSNGYNAITVNSPIAESNICTIPVAATPVVDISVESGFIDNGNLVLPENCALDPDFVGPAYTYIASDKPPVINVSVAPIEEDRELGAIALELLASEDLATLTKEDIENGNYSFEKVSSQNPSLPLNADGAVEEGRYQVRAINYKNHTYAVSEPSRVIETAFIPPVIKDGINVTYTNFRNGEASEVPVIADGLSVPSDVADYANVALTALIPVRDFTITNSSENLDDAIVSYVVEEGELDGNGQFIPVADSDANPSWEQLEVVEDGNGELKFSIGNNDGGYFRIRTENRYKGTIQTAYTGYFLVTFQQ